ncbi:MAG: efflux RND transporter periplasmic adaptor subunit [Pseudomonadota bacterium]
MKKKILKIAIPVAAIFAVLWGGYKIYGYEKSKHEIVLYGNVDIKEVSSSFRVAGRLKTLAFDEGDVVKQGELIASLESDTFANDLELAQANFDATKAQAENAQIRFARTKELFKNDSASKQQFDDEKAALNEIKARLESEKARVKIAQTAFNDTNLYAPSDAFVMTRAFEIGSMIAPSQTVYVLSLTNQSYVRAYVSEKDLGRITNGMAVKIKTDSGTKYEGQIGFISDKAEFTPKSVETAELRTDLVYRVRVTVKNPDAKLKQGMPVTIYLAL